MAYPLQPRPAPGRPSADLQHMGGQNWTPIRGELWTPIDTEIMRAQMQADDDGLLRLLTCFFSHERQEIADFNKAVKQFAADLPEILKALRERINAKQKNSAEFAKAVADFLNHARDAINPVVTEDDVREMLIQHILTEDIFAKVFNDPDYHRKNNVAAELYKLEDQLFADRGEKTTLLKDLGPYYSGIARTAAAIESHSEKQGFLKALYEDFYKAYNKKAADRLGVVYTPSEIVRFMIRNADWLCEKHFGRNLIDRGVEILDPATGTGTFVVELLEHFRSNHDKLRHKYKEELHANEVAILPYYVANLNIEATYQAITGQFAEYENLCLVDTLDNVAALGIYSGHQFDMFGSITDENVERIKRQNRRKISVIIGNPPYNAWQENYNQNNANRPYARVDERIKQTYIKEGTAQNKNSVYDMYTRFVRWASDRLGDEGIIAFVMGRKPISKDAYDGFRKVAEREFSDIWLMDLGGDVRDNPKLSGTTHNVFGIQTGVTIAFLVRRKGKGGAVIRYARRPEMEAAEDKLSFLAASNFDSVSTDVLKPNTRHDWLDAGALDWSSLLPLSIKGRSKSTPSRSIFQLVSSGIQTKMDEWVTARTAELLWPKLKYIAAEYDASLADGIPIDRTVKWHRELARHVRNRRPLDLDAGAVTEMCFRPYSPLVLYFDRMLNSQLFRLHDLFVGTAHNPGIAFSLGKRAGVGILGTDRIPSYDTFVPDACQFVARYRYTKSGERVDNITNWALNKFVAEYGKKGVTKDAVFHYVYAVLHDPVYRETYAMNLKREFPRIPFYADFAQWTAWGEALMALHIGYENVAPWPVVRIDNADPKRAEGAHAKPVLRSDPDRGLVAVDGDTQISGIPRTAWEYKLGNRSAIDWVLDQHKEKTPRDPTIRAKFNAYRFADHKESMIELLAKVVRVSVETVAITKKMAAVSNRNAREVNVG
ncbi:N6 adenine-specific DNA methylase protein (plasmid) [Rhizobium phaseoli]|nr:N6 adenine-specific DNA methylase protein [Rhizobium phaseoli]